MVFHQRKPKSLIRSFVERLKALGTPFFLIVEHDE